MNQYIIILTCAVTGRQHPVWVQAATWAAADAIGIKMAKSSYQYNYLHDCEELK